MRFKLHALIALLLLIGCGKEASSPTAPSAPVATSVTVSPASLLFASLGDTQQLSATVKDQNGAVMASATVTWTTSAASVATVSSTGLVTSVGDGSATVTATSGSASGTATVSVGQVIAAVALSYSALTFAFLADTAQLTATVTDTNGQVIAGATVFWFTSNETVATVSSTGLVTSVADGSASITATSGSAIASASVTVAQVAAAISLSDSALTFGSLADTTQLTATVTDGNGEVLDGATVTWTTSAASVATVS
ncbi:uncharacterized protein METZ01_LOCUS181256, partial [marine metagenome]